MSLAWIGKVIRQHREDGAHDLGRIVHVARDNHVFYWIPLPQTRPQGAGLEGEPAAKVFHLSAPRTWKKKDLEGKLADECGEYSLVEFTEPRAWSYTDDELEAGFSQSDLGQKHRRNTKAWLEKRNQLQAWIDPIVKALSLYELLELGRLNDEVRKRAKELGHPNPVKVARAVRQFLLGCGHPNALLPGWAESGCPGREKFPTKRCGPRRRPVRRGRSNHLGFVPTRTSRANLVAGWRKYKKPGTTALKAYLLTCKEYWPGNTELADKEGRRYLLAAPEDRPTLGDFYCAARRAKLTGTAANMTRRVFELTARPLRGKFDDRIVAVGQLGLIDSTSEDQTPVSSIARLKVLPSTWRTIVVEGKVGYILGVHSGFECPSTLTSLLALFNAASDKVAYCAQWGVTITADQWHSLMCKRIRADNGELKSEIGIITLNSSECAAEFVASFRGDWKALPESSHHSLHRRADHDAAGSTRGKQRQRGEPKCEEDANRTQREHMPIVIQSILYHNNVELVPQLLTTDMRRDGVKPTRKAILEWYLKNGYVASEPWNVDLLRRRCLPRISARIYRDGIHLIDPLDDHRPARLIPQLHYSSEWLLRSALLVKAANGVIDCEVMLDPNDLSRCYFDHGGELHELERRTSDARANELTLCEHLLMIEDDRDVLDDMRAGVQEEEARIVTANRETNKRSGAAKAKEGKASPKKPGKQTRNKRVHRRDELKRRQLESLGFDPDAAPRPGSRGSTAATTLTSPDVPDVSDVPDDDDPSELERHLASQWEAA